MRSARVALWKLRHQRRLRQRFPGAFLGSDEIALTAELGRGVSIGRHVVIGEHVTVGGYTSINRGTIVFSGAIGRFTSIAQFAHIGGHRHPLDHVSMSPRLYRPDGVIGPDLEVEEFPSPPVIGSEVWIGAGAVITQGVTIGHGAVVGAGAVVTHDVAPFTVVAGVPSRPLRQRFDAATVERLLQTAWWDWEDRRLPELLAAVNAGPDFAERLP